MVRGGKSSIALASRTRSTERTAVSASAKDIDVTFALQRFIAAQLSPAIAGTGASLDVVLPTVPRTNEVDLRVGELLANQFLIRPEHRFDFAQDESLPDWAAHVQTVVLVRMEALTPTEDNHLAAIDADDLAITTFELRDIPGEPLFHEPMLERKAAKFQRYLKPAGSTSSSSASSSREVCS